MLADGYEVVVVVLGWTRYRETGLVDDIEKSMCTQHFERMRRRVGYENLYRTRKG